MNGDVNTTAATTRQPNKADRIFIACAAFLGGVLLVSLNANFYVLLVLVALFVATAIVLKPKIPRAAAILVAIFLTIGFFYFNFYLNLRAARQNLVFGRQLDFSGVVLSEPKPVGELQSFDLRIGGKIAGAELRGRITVLAKRFPEIQYGDLLNLRGEIQVPRDRTSRPTVFLPDVLSLKSGHGIWIRERLLTFKHALIRGLKKSLPPDSAALLGGISFGYRADFTDEFKNQMSRSGTTHLVAVSGYNISVLIAAIAVAFGRFLSARRTFYLTALSILFFVLMVGGEASVVRAAIMGFLAITARQAGRLRSMRNALAMAAAAMVAADPTILVFNLGFQLSFLSLLGMAYLLPALQALFRVNPKNLGWFGETAWTTLCAQLGVLPLLAYRFGEFSLTSIVANVLVLGLVPLTMFFGFLLAFAGWLWSYFGAVLGWAVNLIVAYEVGIIKIFAILRLPLPFRAGGMIFAIIYYAILAGIAFYGNKLSEKTKFIRP